MGIGREYLNKIISYTHSMAHTTYGGRKPLKTWLTMVIGSLAISSLIMLLDPGITGYIAMDTGPNPEFNPDFVGEILLQLGR